MKTILLLVSATSLFAQGRLLVYTSAPVNPASLSVTITRLPSTGTTVNLSSATADWRTFPTAVECQGLVCRGDRQLSGSGIQGVFNTSAGSDPNFYPYMHNPGAVNFTWTDGTVSGTGSTGALGNTNLWLNNLYTMKFIADNAVTKTATTYWSVQDPYSPSPTYTGVGTARFTFTMSDGSSAPITRDVAVDVGSSNGLLKIVTTYAAGSDGRELVITGSILTNGDGNTNLIPLAAQLDSAATGFITRTVPAGSDVNSVLESVKPGDTYVFPAETWSGHVNLVARPSISDGSGGYLKCNVRSAGVNLTDSQGVLLSDTSTIWSSPDTDPALQGRGPGIANWNFDGIRFASTVDRTYGLVAFGLAVVPDHTTTTAALPHDIVLNHVIAHGRDGDYGTLKGVTFDVLNGAIKNSNITNIHAASTDPEETNGILIAAGKNIVLSNNEITATGENIMLYTAYLGYTSGEIALLTPNGSTGLVPDNITTGPNNWLYKDTAWVTLAKVKNLWECKNCRNSRTYGNLMEWSFEGTASEGQHGGGITIANRNGGGGDTIARPFAWSHDIEADHNIIRHTGNCLSAFGPYDDKWTQDGPGQAALDAAIAAGMGKMQSINLHDNYCADISMIWTTASSNYPTIIGDAFPATGVRWSGPVNSTVQRNTFLFRETPGVTVASGTIGGVTYSAYTPNVDRVAAVYSSSVADSFTSNNVFNLNLFSWGDPGCDSTSGTGCFTSYQPVYTWTNNVQQNLWHTVASWTSFFGTANGSYPGHWSGNSVSADSSAAVTGAGAPSDILANEAVIRARGR